jgi:hypothetical protein
MFDLANHPQRDRDCFLGNTGSLLRVAERRLMQKIANQIWLNTSTTQISQKEKENA